MCYKVNSIQTGGIESFYLWDVFEPKVLKHFKHKHCLILVKNFQINKWFKFI